MKTILIVDDEYSIVESITDLLTDEGYRVVAAANGREALDQIGAVRPDLVLCDIMMPVMDGRALLAALRADPALARLPVIMMSAAAAPLRPEEADGVPVLKKPFEIDLLLAHLRERLSDRPR